MTYRNLWTSLTKCYDEGEARAVARLVLEQRFGLTIADILAGRDQTLPDEELETIRQRLLKGEPVQYVLGEALFCGRNFHVGPGVLIPRPETEELCRIIIETASGWQQPLRILDIGTGSGCIAVTLALELPGAQVMAWDISPTAVHIASDNARRLGAEVQVVEHNALAAGGDPCLSPCLERDSSTNLPVWDIIVSNPPYVFEDECDDMEPHVLRFEPHEALFAPDDNPWPLYHSIARYAAQTLRPQHLLFFETNPRMAQQLQSDVQAEMGSGSASVIEDSYGKQRFVKGRKEEGGRRNEK